jgi:3-deoxy-manno-octulosonate cytidylyltransferase (CMP-KDO synthetase)
VSSPRVLGVIPARYASTRFEGKPLALIRGREMILWVCDGARQSRQLEEIWVATDDERIASVVRAAGFQAVMTDPALPSGTDRIQAALEKNLQKKFDIVVNIQGDEPLISGALIDRLIEPMLQESSLEMATLAHTLSSDELKSVNAVKVVVNQRGEALYFSRFPIPFSRVQHEEKAPISCAFKHIGMYAYRTSFLRQFCAAPQAEIEIHESLEQLRALALGARIKVVLVNERPWGVDTPQDLAKIEEILRSR